MLRLRKKDALLELVEQAIEDVAKEMLSLNSDSDEYAKMNNQLTQLIKTRTEMTSRNKISKETWATIIANFVGIVLVLNYERGHVLASKAFSQITKLKM